MDINGVAGHARMAARVPRVGRAKVGYFDDNSSPAWGADLVAAVASWTRVARTLPKRDLGDSGSVR